MNIKDLDLTKAANLTSQYIDYTICLECCKHYKKPQTAACGHTLCHSCWAGRHLCPTCNKPVEHHKLRHNRLFQNLAKHAHIAREAIEKILNKKLDEFLLESGEAESENENTKNVKDWLASSQNHFSVPPQSPPEIQHDVTPLNISSNKIQIHTNIPKTRSPVKVVHVSVPQDDWDKIEPMPDTEDYNKNKENVVGPMDIEPFEFDGTEYTVEKPRRSSRKREMKPIVTINKSNENISLQKQSSKDSSGEIDKKSNKSRQNWNNVKRMRKEFSKLNKKNRNKLNVSIEMCKKAQSTTQTNIALPEVNSPQVYDIDENTPDHFNIDRQMIKEIPKESIHDVQNKRQKVEISQLPEINKGLNNESHSESILEFSKPEGSRNRSNTIIKNRDCLESNAETIHSFNHVEFNTHNANEKASKTPFYKKSVLYPKCLETNKIKTINHNVDTNTTTSDDIEITIKVGNTITYVTIKKKHDVELKVSTDREIQTTLEPSDKIEKKDKLSQNIKAQNIVISVGDQNYVDIEQTKTKPYIELKTKPAKKTVSEKKNTDSVDTGSPQFEITELKTKPASVRTVSEKKNTDSADTGSAQYEITELKTKPASVRTVSEKKNTDSADTGSAQYEITESIEKELSKVMECVEVDEPIQSKSSLNVKEKSSQSNKSPKTATNEHDHEYLNDLDIFDSESVKELDEHAPSEILLCTIKTKNKTQKHNEKRNRPSNDNEEDTLPKSKKAKLNNERCISANDRIEPNRSIHNQSESEPIEYDETQIDKAIQEEVALSGINKIGSLTANEYCSKQKDSENVFSLYVEKDNEIVNAAHTNEKVLLNVPSTNIEDFLTPVMRQNLESTCEALVVDNSVEVVNEDSESVVEETPQKSTSFSKTKQKSNGTNKEVNQSQRLDLSEQRVVLDKKSSESKKYKSIVNLTDTEINSGKDVTVMDNVDKKKSLETPSAIKFTDQMKYTSTPLARKSLLFDAENMEDFDPHQTLCSTNDAVAKTTQEREFLSKAFEKTPTTPAVKLLGTRNLGLRHKRACIAGSCLTPTEIANLKLLCTRHKWIYADKYMKALTHLVVGVDEENRSQRSVKYMCALASSKWIISYEWVEKCLESKGVVNEEYFEVVDSTGEPGPRRSRVALKKLFEGITFFCMGPFSVLDIDTLQDILEAAGGRVVKDIKQVKLDDKSSTPAILLAEPENTQEDRFIYLAMELSIVPVNHEWVLNCLGSYTLSSIQELLLCPASLLPAATVHWPQQLIEREDE